MPVCYRHPSRETGVSCSSCGRPICPDCMTPTSVGMRCPECARDRTKVRTMRSVSGTPVVTRALIVLNVIVFLAETATGVRLGGCTVNCGAVWNHGALLGYPIAHQHQYWRIVSSGFLHDGILHIAVNMLSLYFVGAALEPAVGRFNFAAIYFVSLLAGSFGALLFQPNVPTVGASGAIFGIFGALIVVAYHRGIPIWQSGLGFILLINLIFSVTYSGISIGGHLGGLVAGLLCGEIVVRFSERRRQPGLVYLGFAVVAIASVVGAVAVAGSTGLAPGGLTI
ncbi:MAG TPA: rhomboid family intramembrane serine protease [Solirubrobacteraceae bacterium]|nr:rhomboid family intramembrane serine protease [Solirubrobacteraceae bacterium]